MIILLKSYGDHSNRLFQNLWIEAFCLEHDLKFVNPTFKSLCKYYKNPVETNTTIMLSILRIKSIRLILKKINLINMISLKAKEDYNEVLSVASDKDCYLEGWQNPGDFFIQKYKLLLRQKYSLKEEYYFDNAMYLKILSLNRQECILVGIHIRRGDYKKWRDGKYYFSDKTYMKYMKEMKKTIENLNNKKCVFIIFSVENTSFQETDSIWISKNSWYLDQFLMGQCDYIVGPPSTFSMWASLVGTAKYFHIENPGQKIELQNFKSY